MTRQTHPDAFSNARIRFFSKMTNSLIEALALPFTHKIKLDSKIQAVYTLRHEPTKPNQTDPDEECKHKIRLQFA